MNVDKGYCMSAFLTFRYVPNPEKQFRGGIEHIECTIVPDSEKYPCKTIDDIENHIIEKIDEVKDRKTALLLSGGIDSGILASYMPKGSVAYTVDSPAEVAKEEIKRAKEVCDKYGLEHRIVEVTWQDYEKCIDILMKHDGCPVFANEPQVYALAKRIKEDGFGAIIFGDNADAVFGGYNLLLSKDWTFDGWVDRFTFIKPERVLRHPVEITEVYEHYRTGTNSINYLQFMNEVFAISSSGAYVNAFECLGLDYMDPYADMKMADSLDLDRVRSGDSKYMLRELYSSRFPDFEVPEKIAMARAVDVWLKDWEGPTRDEFIPGCTRDMTGEQKFMVYSLERFLSLMDI